MKRYVCLFLLLVGTALVAQTAPTPEESAVLQVQRTWLQASQKADGATLRQIIDDSFVGNTPNNHIIDKESLFPPSGSQPMFTDARFGDLNARVIGNTAVVFGDIITGGGPGALRCTMVYIKRGGTWTMIAAQLVPVSVTASQAEGQ